MKCKQKNLIKDSTKCLHYRSSSDASAGLCSLPNEFRCIEAIENTAMKLSHSSLMNFLRCKRLYYYNNIKGLRVRPEMLSQPLLMGGLYDKYMEMEYNTGKEIEIDKTNMTNVSIVKVKTIMRVIRDLELKPQLDGYISSQFHFDCKLDDALVQGYYDRKYSDHFVEMKFTGSPQYYNTAFEIQNQIGTYFLADEAMEYCIMEITVAPQLRLSKKSKKRLVDESPDEYYERVYEAILKQPSKYFIGLNRDKGTWGKKFYRKEFDLKAIKKRYECITTEIRESAKRGWFYQNTTACNMFGGKCDYYDLCKSDGYVSEMIYTKRSKDNGK